MFFIGCSVCPHLKQLILFAIKWQRPLLDQRQANLRYKNQCFQGSLLSAGPEVCSLVLDLGTTRIKQMTIWEKLIKQMIWERVDQINDDLLWVILGFECP